MHHSLYPDLPSAHNNLGTLLNDTRAAEIHYQAALRIYPDHKGAMVNLGTSLVWVDCMTTVRKVSCLHLQFIVIFHADLLKCLQFSYKLWCFLIIHFFLDLPLSMKYDILWIFVGFSIWYVFFLLAKEVRFRKGRHWLTESLTLTRRIWMPL